MPARRISFRISGETARQVEKLARENRCSVHDVAAMRLISTSVSGRVIRRQSGTSSGWEQRMTRGNCANFSPAWSSIPGMK
jgi:hypothetical protein